MWILRSLGPFPVLNLRGLEKSGRVLGEAKTENPKNIEGATNDDLSHNGDGYGIPLVRHLQVKGSVLIEGA